MTVRRWTKHVGINYPVFFSRSDESDIQIKQAYPAKIQTFQEVGIMASATAKAKHDIEDNAQNNAGIYTNCIKCGEPCAKGCLTLTNGEMIHTECWEAI